MSFMLRALFILLSLSLLVCSHVNAGPIDRFERLVMPGKLSAAHAKYENDCNQCHKSFEKGAQNELCMDCHKKVGRDVREEQGMHGRLRDIQTRSCSDCHAEHKGRDYNIVPFDRDTFDHARTDFPLRGSHMRLSCIDCHKKDEKYRKVEGGCATCHKEDDIHQQRLGDKCENCHIESVWGEAHFNHDKTDFKLKAAHNNTLCMNCHPNQQYKDTPKDCVACHRLDDVHEDNHGKKCQDCHVERNWSEIRFDHDKDTKYKLKGRHQRVGCQACHQGDVYKKIKNKRQCITCHEKEDAHKGFFGKKCQDCHTEVSWTRMVFNHNRKTDFPLKGRHKKVECTLCHLGDVYAELKTDCYSCHRQDDAHNGEEGKKCGRCHDESGWDAKVFFDHDLTAFPLLDSHAITPCEECHYTPEFKGAPTDCKSCHIKDDERVHKQRLTLQCELCHNANDWKKWFFDHNTQTDYKLDGAHENLDCHACHNKAEPKEIELGMKCFDCHEQDDKHNGAFGRECERCHVTSSFKEFKLTQ